MDPIVLHHAVSDSVLIGIVAATALVSFAAGVGFARWRWQEPRRRADRAVETAE